MPTLVHRAPQRGRNPDRHGTRRGIPSLRKPGVGSLVHKNGRSKSRQSKREPISWAPWSWAFGWAYPAGAAYSWTALQEPAV